MSRRADIAEEVQLAMGSQLLAHVDDMLPTATEAQLRFLAERLTEALRDILRVAENRGQIGQISGDCPPERSSS
ncbi:hypothetical protein AB0929_16540 [Streptomyces massasporeus]|uniref:hypothetical protein n=1 Tax=Streptomyces massasporeus TaxID=67324 RepID=UPI0034543B96